MSSNEKTLLQIKVNRIQLQKDLKALNRAKETDLRLQQAKEIQFRRKYEKYLTRGNFETSLIKKDNFKKVTQEDSVISSQSSEVVPIHKLIYTNGEVDIEKVICLHLLSVQLLDITAFTGKRNLQLFPKRSDSNMFKSSALQFYIVEIMHQIDTEMKLELRGGQDIIILVNRNLEKLIKSILEVLAIVSPQKLEKIKELSRNKKSIQEMMIKPKIYNFLAQISESPVLFKMANYHLEIAQYQEEPIFEPSILSLCSIKLKDKSNKLEQVQTKIKKAIAKHTEEDMTSGESWSMFHKRLCSCKKASSRPSVVSRNAIALLSDDGTGLAVVTGSGCHLPTKSSIYCPSLTAIIKSSPHQQSFKMAEEKSGYLLHTKGSPFFKNDNRSLVSSLLFKVNNTQRILIGKKAAELKPQNPAKKAGKQKLPLNKIFEDVFTKQSLVSFASNTGNEELKLLFQPCCKGGLGIGSYILEPDKKGKPTKRVSSSERLESVWNYDDGVIPQIIQQEKAIMHTAQVKQEIFTSETRTKIKHFLQTENPGANQI